MPTNLTTEVIEQSTAAITITFEDTAGNAFQPDTLTWTLTDELGVVINDREEVEFAVMAESMTVILSGDDLQIQDREQADETCTRKVTFQGTYDSDLSEDLLPFVDECTFTLRNLIYVTT